MSIFFSDAYFFCQLGNEPHLCDAEIILCSFNKVNSFYKRLRVRVYFALKMFEVIALKFQSRAEWLIGYEIAHFRMRARSGCAHTHTHKSLAYFNAYTKIHLKCCDFVVAAVHF